MKRLSFSFCLFPVSRFPFPVSRSPSYDYISPCPSGCRKFELTWSHYNFCCWMIFSSQTPGDTINVRSGVGCRFSYIKSMNNFIIIYLLTVQCWLSSIQPVVNVAEKVFYIFCFHSNQFAEISKNIECCKLFFPLKIWDTPIFA